MTCGAMPNGSPKHATVHTRHPWAALVLAGVCALCGKPACLFAQAMPANPTVQCVAQPDGSCFLARMRGDEHQGWMETLDGYTVIKNKKDCEGRKCWFEYAKRGKGQQLVPSGVVVGHLEQFPRGQRPPKGLRPAPNTPP